MHDAQLITVACLALIGGLWLFASSFGRLKLRLAVMNTPTSKIQSVAMGKCELKGQSRPLGQPLRAPFSDVPCLWYRWAVEEEHTDSKGNTSWSTIAQGESIQPFLIEDATGSLQVQPAGAEVEAPKLFLASSGGLFSSASKMAGPLAAQYAGGFFTAKRRYSEWQIMPGIPLYVLGMLRNSEGRSYIGQGRNDEAFVISVGTEEELLRGLQWSVWGRMIGGALLATGAAAFMVAAFYRP